MDEPTYSAESVFWDEVAEWILDAHAMEPGILTEAEIEALIDARPLRPNRIQCDTHKRS